LGKIAMRELTKKLTVTFVLLLVLISGFAGASVSSAKESSSDDSACAKTVTLYRYGPDGTVTPIRTNVYLEGGQNLDEVIAEKCSELLDNDIEMQNYVSSNGLKNISYWSHVSSWGIGQHWKSPFRFHIPLLVLLRFKLFPDVPLWYKIFGINVIPWVFCSYMNDENAHTKIETLPTPTRPDNTTIINGMHNVTAFAFFGYTYWRGTHAKWFDNSGKETGFDGYAIITWIHRKNT
jgi:hypothetical protein